ncbi:hypothetical protein SAMN02745121_06972 [Nannocystis exedens]|uniref:Uncharacterized protein n=1 Tax=Nannocystis exedens TaxID=54 RepID=A0A1I2G1I2_9BACT|nr:hypothetical protein NAEX_07703 [Nannocystis exedens]SFF10830.1 hypothetical protein SAMN02745121_06972 [Nannocystis exedens]
MRRAAAVSRAPRGERHRRWAGPRGAARPGPHRRRRPRRGRATGCGRVGATSGEKPARVYNTCARRASRCSAPPARRSTLSRPGHEGAKHSPSAAHAGRDGLAAPPFRSRRRPARRAVVRLAAACSRRSATPSSRCTTSARRGRGPSQRASTLACHLAGSRRLADSRDEPEVEGPEIGARPRPPAPRVPVARDEQRAHGGVQDPHHGPRPGEDPGHLRHSCPIAASTPQPVDVSPPTSSQTPFQRRSARPAHVRPSTASLQNGLRSRVQNGGGWCR